MYDLKISSRYSMVTTIARDALLADGRYNVRRELYRDWLGRWCVTLYKARYSKAAPYELDAGLVAELDRRGGAAPVVTISHHKDCPVNRPGSVPASLGGDAPCLCDFGERLGSYLETDIEPPPPRLIAGRR